MNFISLEEIDPQACFNRLCANPLVHFRDHDGGMLVDPADPASLVSQYRSLGQDRLKAIEFAELAHKTALLRQEVRQILNNGGTIAVLLRAPCRLEHESHGDLAIGNYDWLWSGAGQDNRLEIVAASDSSCNLAEYGANSPLQEYGQLTLVPEMAGKGDIHTLARDGHFNAVSFMMFEGRGKIVFLPPFSRQNPPEKLIAALRDMFTAECWPPVTPPDTLEPAWLDKYNFPETKVLEKALSDKEDKIARLEEECEYAHRNLLQIKQLQKDLLAGNAQGISTALCAILSQWGAESLLYGDSLRLVAGTREGVVLAVNSEGEVPLWAGKKLARMLASEKGILVANAHRREDPREPKAPLYSQALLQFAQERKMALVSCWDVFRAHCLGRKDLLELLWNETGVVSPDWLR